MGYSGSIFANWGRRGSQIRLSAPTECTLAYVQHQRVGTGMQRREARLMGSPRTVKRLFGWKPQVTVKSTCTQVMCEIKVVILFIL